MLAELFIPNKRPQETALDQQQLFSLGLGHVQRLASRVWSDYNVHDPGITTLELLCYALTDLSYRATLPLEDLLADEKGTNGPPSTLFGARQILPCRPVTELDYRKLLIDLNLAPVEAADSAADSPAPAPRRRRGIKNAWLEAASISYFADTCEGELFGPACLLAGEIVDLPALAARLREPADPLAHYLAEQLTEATQQALARHRANSEAEPLASLLRRDLNRLIHEEEIFDSRRCAEVSLSPEVRQLLEVRSSDEAVLSRKRLFINRLLLEDAFPESLARNRLLRQKALLQGIREVPLDGLYEVVIDYADGIDDRATKELVQKKAQQTLHANRNLGEDFIAFREVECESFLLCAAVELTPQAETARIKAEILHRVQQYLSPTVRSHSLQEMLGRQQRGETSFTMDELFDGPLLEWGFIDDAELAAAQLRREIRLSDIINIIMDIVGVQSVREIAVRPEKGEAPPAGAWSVAVSPGKKALLNPERSVVSLYKRSMPMVPDKDQVAAERQRLAESESRDPAEPPANDLPQPKGSWRNPGSYYSFQNHFPELYGLGETGLGDSADNGRRAQVYQLKAYLLFFDQVMANYFAQLSRVRELFSIDPQLKRTYFSQVVDSFIDFENIYGENVQLSGTGAASATDLLENSTKFQERRHRFLDHLIARFAERFTDFVHIMYACFGATPESMIAVKCAFLKDYPAISSERSLAYDRLRRDPAALWNSGNVSGLERRLARLLGIRNFRRRNLGEIAYQVYAEIDSTPRDEFRFRLFKGDSNKILLSSSTNFATQELARASLKLAIRCALNGNLQRKLSADGRHFFNVLDTKGEICARRIEYFESAEAMERAIAELGDYLQENFSDEGMYLIENILLRPELADDPYLRICSAGNQTACADCDPYSFRLHIILPAYGSRFGDNNFRRFAEEVIREETPAHLLPKICWISADDMANFERLYQEWLSLKAGVSTARRRETLASFYEELFRIKNVYPSSHLHEVDSAENLEKFILGRTSIGSGPAGDAEK